MLSQWRDALLSLHVFPLYNHFAGNMIILSYFPPSGLKQAKSFLISSQPHHCTALMARFQIAGNRGTSALTIYWVPGHFDLFWTILHNILSSCLLLQLSPAYSGIPRARSSLETAAELRIKMVFKCLKIVSEIRILRWRWRLEHLQEIWWFQQKSASVGNNCQRTNCKLATR